MRNSKKLTTTFSYGPGTFRISHKILEVLGNPKYIVLLVNLDENKVSYTSSDRSDRSSLHIVYTDYVKKTGKVFNSTRFVRKLFHHYKWNINSRYQIRGVFHEKYKIVEFDLNEAYVADREICLDNFEINRVD